MMAGSRERSGVNRHVGNFISIVAIHCPVKDSIDVHISPAYGCTEASEPSDTVTTEIKLGRVAGMRACGLRLLIDSPNIPLMFPPTAGVVNFLIGIINHLYVLTIITLGHDLC